MAVKMLRYFLLKRVPPEDRHGTAVLVVTFAVIFFVTGITSFLENIVEEFLRRTGKTVSDDVADYIFGMHSVCSVLVSLSTDAAVERYGHAVLFRWGSMLACAGFFSVAFYVSTSVMIFGFGVCVAVGSSLVVNVCTHCALCYFSELKPIALVVTLSGSKLGSYFVPIALNELMFPLTAERVLLSLSGVFLLLTYIRNIFRDPEQHFITVIDRDRVFSKQIKMWLADEFEKHNSGSRSVSRNIRARIGQFLKPRGTKSIVILLSALCAYYCTLGNSDFIEELIARSMEVRLRPYAIHENINIYHLVEVSSLLVYACITVRHGVHHGDLATALIVHAICAFALPKCSTALSMKLVYMICAVSSAVISVSFALLFSAWGPYDEREQNSESAIECSQALAGFSFGYLIPLVRSNYCNRGVMSFRGNHSLLAALFACFHCVLTNLK